MPRGPALAFTSVILQYSNAKFQGRFTTISQRLAGADVTGKSLPAAVGGVTLYRKLVARRVTGQELNYYQYGPAPATSLGT